MFYSINLRLKLLVKILMTLFGLEMKNYKGQVDMKITLGSFNLSYLKLGRRKPVVVFLHGWGQSKETWVSILKKLKIKYTCYAIDLPGFGKSSSLSKPLLLKDYARILDDFLIALKIKNCILVGHSFGGKIATEFVLKYPEKVDKLIIYSADLGTKNTPTVYAVNIIVGLFGIFPFNIFLVLYSKLMNKSYKRLEVLRKVFLNNRKNTNFNRRLSRIKKNVLLLFGVYDFIAPLDFGRNINGLIPNSDLVIFSKSSHLAHIEEEGKFIREIFKFIE